MDEDIYKEADQTNLQIQSCSVKIEDGEIVIDLSVKSNIEFKKNWIVEIGYGRSSYSLSLLLVEAGSKTTVLPLSVFITFSLR